MRYGYSNVLKGKCDINRSRAGKKQGRGENASSEAVIGRLPGFCSHSSSISSFRGHLMTAQTGYFSCPHIAIDLEKVN